jgi:hypothetical protein
VGGGSVSCAINRQMDPFVRFSTRRNYRDEEFGNAGIAAAVSIGRVGIVQVGSSLCVCICDGQCLLVSACACVEKLFVFGKSCKK